MPINFIISGSAPKRCQSFLAVGAGARLAMIGTRGLPRTGVRRCLARNIRKSEAKPIVNGSRMFEPRSLVLGIFA
eukprot:1977504-Amphidinium_carterae.1